MKKFKMPLLLFSLVASFGVTAQAQTSHDILGLAAQTGSGLHACLAKAKTSSDKDKCLARYAAELAAVQFPAAAAGMYFTAAVLAGNPFGAAVAATAYMGDTVANASYQYTNTSTMGALKNLGNDPSLQGSYLWNQEHQADPASQHRAAEQAAMAADGIYDDTPASVREAAAAAQ